MLSCVFVQCAAKASGANTSKYVKYVYKYVCVCVW